MKKLFTILAVAMCSTLAMAQTNQYFWAGGQFIMGNPIGQIDSVTFGQLEQTDSVLLYLPRTIKVIHDTIIQYVTIHDTICPEIVPEGAIEGLYSISDTMKVYFSRGNLQYMPSLKSWRFAEKQYDYIGSANSNVMNEAFAGWLDLFGWSTVNSNFGLSSSMNILDYKGDFVDWGINKICGSNSWRTLSKSEYEYLFTKRVNANTLYSFATVNNVKGIILLPDNWVAPTNITFVPRASNYKTNNYSIEQWQIMEAAGVVFLPTAGFREGTGVYQVGSDGGYYSSTEKDSNQVYHVGFLSTFQFPSGGNDKCRGYSVRLVQEVK